MIETIKQRLKSKTINFGLLLSMSSLIQLYFDQIGYGLASLIVGLIIIWLREQTTQALGDK